MRDGRFTILFIGFIAILLAASCQKDPADDAVAPKASITADSSAFASPGNFLAVSGTLKVKLNDSTYTFDAANDSIAFINVHVDDSNHYFGITAINKAHNMSFGISSPGFVDDNINKRVAGSQFLLGTDDKKPTLQLSLSKYQRENDFGSINIEQYNQDGILAKGTFYTFLAKDDKANSPYYRVEGTFDLRLK